MALGRLFRKLMGGGEPPSEWAELDTATLDRLWRARAALSPRMVRSLREESLRRHHVLPFTELATPWAPPPQVVPAGGLDGLFRRDGLIEYLGRLDAHSREPEAFQAFSTGAWFGADEDRIVAVVMPSWRADHPLESADGVSDVVVLPGDVPGPSDAALDAAWSGAAVHRLDAEAPREQTFGRLQLTWDGRTLVVDDEENELRFLVGASIPIAALAPVPDAVIGSLSVTIEDTEIVPEIDQSDLVRVDRLIILPDVAGTSGLPGAALGAAIGLPVATVGHGLPLTPTAQACVAAVRQARAVNEGNPLESSDELPDDDALLEAFAWFAVEAELDHAGSLIDQLAERAAPEPTRADGGEGPDAGEQTTGEQATSEPDASEDERPTDLVPLLRGMLAELRGDLTGAEAAYRSASADDAARLGLADHHRAALLARRGELAEAAAIIDALYDPTTGNPDPHPVSGANAAVIVWMHEGREAAARHLMAEQQTAASWLGTMMEAAVHDAPEPVGVFPAAARLAPAATAQLYLRSGQFDEAIRLFERSLALCPNLPAALAELVRHHLRTGAAGEARALAEKGLESWPTFAHLRVLAAHAALAQNEPAAAATHLTRAVNQLPDRTEWHLARVEALRRVGDTDALNQAIGEAADQLDDRPLIDAIRRAM